MKKINLVIVEDHPFTRQTLVYEFKKQEGINLLASFDNGADVVEFVKTQQVDVILMDIDMPKMNGIDATSEIKKFNNDILIVMLTNHNEKEKVLGAFKSGANAYCVKQVKMDELMSVIEIVNDGGVWFDKQIAKYVMEILKCVDVKEEETKAKTINDYDITKRERNILKLIADGYTNAQIAEELTISEHTAKAHVCNIIQKLVVDDRTQAAVKAIKEGLV